jgi:hypothetical protein
MNQNDLPYVGSIIMVTINNRIQPAVVCRHLPNNEVLVRFINNNVVHSQLNFREQFGTNILIVERADNYIPYRLEDTLNDTDVLNLQELQTRYNLMLDEINLGNYILNSLGHEGGQRKRKSKKSNNRRIKRSRQRR